MTERFTAQAVYLIPVLASLMFGLACASTLLPQSFAPIPVTPFPENSPSGPIGNAIYFVVLVAVSATVFYILLKRKSQKIINVLISLALTTAALLLSLIYLSAVLAYFPSLEFLVIPLSIIMTILFDLAVFRWSSRARNTAVVCLGGALGVFFGFFIPFWSALLILVFLAVYDVVTVYYGPVGKIAQSGLDQLKGLSYSFKDIQMGLGDLVFYSMLSGTMLFNFQPNFLPCFVSIISILAGSFLTLLILERKNIFPGLPLPVFLGLAGGLLASLI
ncbi:MAG: presenilin family intramembrane aspartyl protease [Candidatus Bathyarchaeota archaeon]|nr:presenilin family intramembrane aspartyl protease [Candidatus Bathyarchaeota archaeon]